MSLKINDTVVVLSGKDQGKQGIVLEILPKKGKVRVKDIALLTKHYKARKQGEASGIKKQEGWIDRSNVMLVCSSCKKPSRQNAKKVMRADKEQAERICNRCKEIF